MAQPSTRLPLWSLAVLALALAGCGETAQSSPSISAGWTPAPQDTAKPLAVDQDGGTQALEVCDGIDNDGDGLIDEDIPAEFCAMGGAKGNGATRCMNGRVMCLGCTPGETKTAPCGCNIDRTDTCLSDGTWREGSCNGCPPTKVCELCVPGERITRRCDGCAKAGADAGSCGATCLGSVWECKGGCAWEQVSTCVPLNPMCSGDMSVVEACGNCGTRRKFCDGCFWNTDICADQGTCTPGSKQQTPCFKNQCSSGTSNINTCGANCKWNVAATCGGCTPGVTVTTIDCVGGNPQCGQRQREVTCALTPVLTCGGSQNLPVGKLTTRILGVCPATNACFPGSSSSQACTQASGLAGTRPITCKTDCTWDTTAACAPPPACPASQVCTPNAATTVQRSCGGNTCGLQYAETTTCASSGCGSNVTADWSTCPACAAGQSRQVACTTSTGQCGTAPVLCNSSCAWDPLPAPGSPQCVANAGSCVPGSTKVNYPACNPPTCGRTFAQVLTCTADGCGYALTSEDKSTCAVCVPGVTETTTTLCKPATPLCGYVQRKCDATTCDWVTLACPVCG